MKNCFSGSGKNVSPKQRSIIDAVKRNLYKHNPPWIVDSGHAEIEVYPESFKEMSLLSLKHLYFSDDPQWIRGMKHKECLVY